MKNIFFLFLATVLLVSCGQDKTRVKAMEDEAIAIHDEVMPEMGTIIELKSQLMARMSAIDTTQVDSLNAFQTQMDNLIMAEEGMKNWMHSYEVPDYNKSIEELEPKMIQQLADIKEVREQMKTAIADAKTLLGTE